MKRLRMKDNPARPTDLFQPVSHSSASGRSLSIEVDLGWCAPRVMLLPSRVLHSPGGGRAEKNAQS